MAAHPGCSSVNQNLRAERYQAQLRVIYIGPVLFLKAAKRPPVKSEADLG